MSSGCRPVTMRTSDRIAVLARCHRITVSHSRRSSSAWVVSAVVIAVATGVVVRWVGTSSGVVVERASVALVSFPHAVLLFSLTVPSPAGTMRPEHLRGLPVPTGAAWTAFVRARVGLGVTPVRVTVLGVYAAAAVVSGWAPALVVLAVFVFGAPLGHVAATVPATGGWRVARGALVVTGVGAVPVLALRDPLWSVAASVVVAAVWGASSVVAMRRALDPLGSVSVAAQRDRASDATWWRLPHLRAVVVDLQRNRRWTDFAAGWVLIVLVGVAAAGRRYEWSIGGAQLGLDVTPAIPVLAVYAMFGLTFGLLADGDAASWIVDVPNGVRRYLWARVAVWVVVTAPCWLIASLVVAWQNGGAAWTSVPMLFAAIAIRGAVTSTRFGAPSPVRIVVDLVGAAVGFAVLTGVLVSVPPGVGLVVLGSAVALLVTAALLVTRTWRDGGAAWLRAAERAHR